MGWREVLVERFNDAQREWRNGERDTCSVSETILSLPATDRIALARELLAGTDARVVTWAEWDARREAAIQEGREIYRDAGG